MTYIWPAPSAPGAYLIEGDRRPLAAGDVVDVRYARAWRPARIDQDAGGYKAVYTDRPSRAPTSPQACVTYVDDVTGAVQASAGAWRLARVDRVRGEIVPVRVDAEGRAIRLVAGLAVRRRRRAAGGAR